MANNKYDSKVVSAMEKEEAKEHVSFSKKQIHQIAMDHLKAHPMAENEHFKKISDTVAAMESGENEDVEEASMKPNEKNKAKVEAMVDEHKKKHGK